LFVVCSLFITEFYLLISPQRQSAIS